MLEKVKEGVEIDAKCMADIKSGRPVKESFAEHRGIFYLPHLFIFNDYFHYFLYALY